MKMLFRQGGVGERKVSIALTEADVMGARRGGSAYNPTSGDVGCLLYTSDAADEL